MNMIRDCIDQLKRIGQGLQAVVRAENAQTAPDTQNATCGCGRDACQIGDGADSCKPQRIIAPESISGGK